MVKLSLIIPYYNTYELTKELLEKLKQQLTNEVEVIIIDDGCDEWRFNQIAYSNGDMRCIHLCKNSGGASYPRNIGIEHARGGYIAFIDSDDDIADNYINEILKAIKKKPDIIFLSWQSKKRKIIMREQPPTWNCSVWCRVYKRNIIGNIRFDENLKIAEDWVFNQQIKYETKECIHDIIYYYNNDRKGSLLHS